MINKRQDCSKTFYRWSLEALIYFKTFFVGYVQDIKELFALVLLDI